MKRRELMVGEPAKCVKGDADGFFKVGDITWVNQLVKVPEKPGGKPKQYAMMQHQQGFVYLPAKFFIGLTEEEVEAFEKQQQELLKKHETPN